MQREKLYNLNRETYSNCVRFVFKKSKTVCDQLLRLQKLIAQNFSFFENKSNNLYCEDCRAFHAASCGVFYFSSDKAFL